MHTARTWLEQGDIAPRRPSEPDAGVAWDLAAWWLGMPAPAPDVTKVASLTPTPETPAVAAAGARAALIDFDGETLVRWVGLLQGLDDGEVQALLYEACSRLMQGNAERAASGFEAAAEAGASTRNASVRIEATLGQALALAELGQGDESVSYARRGFRMARSEALPHHEVLASIRLGSGAPARGRAPELACRILSSIAELAPRPWAGWLLWESHLAGATVECVGSVGSRSLGAATHLDLGLRALRQGKVDEARRELQLARHFPQGAGPFAAELEDLCSLLERGVEATGRVTPWRGGELVAVPRGLFNLATSHTASSSLAYVVADPGRPAERVLTAGLPLSCAHDCVRLSPSARPRERTAAAIVWLLRRGATPVDETTFFEDLYGFAFNPGAHRAVLDTLLHRVRTMLGDAAHLERTEGQLHLSAHVQLAVWDPSCSAPLEGRLLALLARLGPQNPDEAARELGYSRRAVLDGLKALIEDGTCRRQKSGRRVQYLVEDTAFRIPLAPVSVCFSRASEPRRVGWLDTGNRG